MRTAEAEGRGRDPGRDREGRAGRGEGWIRIDPFSPQHTPTQACAPSHACGVDDHPLHPPSALCTQLTKQHFCHYYICPLRSTYCIPPNLTHTYTPIYGGHRGGDKHSPSFHHHLLHIRAVRMQRQAAGVRDCMGMRECWVWLGWLWLCWLSNSLSVAFWTAPVARWLSWHSC